MKKYPFQTPALFLSCFALGCAQGGAEDAGDGRIDSGITLMDSSIPDGRVLLDASLLCGNGAIDDGEECDQVELDDQTCATLGYDSGDLRCLVDCTFNKEVCIESDCGNGALDPGEECEATDLNGQSCTSQGFVGGGDLACSSTCMFDTASCVACGDAAVTGSEECDGTNLDGSDCIMRGFLGGVLACDVSCGFNTSACFDATCGDGAIGGSEDCDMSDLNSMDCMDVGFHAGTLTCNGDCTFNVSACHQCGNGSRDGLEDCDGSDLGPASCMSEGFTMGALACAGDCTFDTAGCSTAACGNGTIESGETCDDSNVTDDDGCTSCMIDPGWMCSGAPSSCNPVCGNGVIHGGEDCDGGALDGETCMSRGFDDGTLNCSACRFDESACTTTTCGNGTYNAGEECDDGNVLDFDGCDSSCQVDSGFDLPVRLRNGDGSNHGMLEVRFEGAWRDVCDDTPLAAERQAMADIVCAQLGFTGTGHQFINAFGGGSGTPVMDDVRCTGTEDTLAQCPFSGWNRENCSGFEAVGIRCMPAVGDIRLVDGPHGMEGRLQIFQGGSWGEVCDDYFDGAYAAYFGYSTTTVCQQMGYAGGLFLSTYDAPSNTFVLDDVNCTGTERRIGDCPHPPYGTENCFDAEGAGFRCSLYAENDIRLREGSARNDGRVELLHDSVWGTVCDDIIQFSGPEQTGFIQVGCRQLGYTTSGSVQGFFGGGVDPIWLDNVMCGGTESSVASCTSNGWNVHNCSHVEDVGLICDP